MGTLPAIIDPHLDGIAATIVRTGERAGVPIQHLGHAPLFDEPRLFCGLRSDWILSPAHLDPHAEDGMVIPRAEMNKLATLLEANLDFPATYVAHEVHPDRVGELGLTRPDIDDAASVTGGTSAALVPGGHALVSADSFMVIDPAIAAEVIEAPPAPERTAKVSRGLGKATEVTTRAIAKAAPIVAGVALAPLAVGALAAAMPMDPIIFGAMTADGSDTPGTPAAFFVLCQWDW